MIPDEDLDISCMEFVRSAPSPDTELNGKTLIIFFCLVFTQHLLKVHNST